jgi:AcrR family transcriptional regulator
MEKRPTKSVATDRRARRTRKLLHDALLGLMLERDFEGITVQDILDRADIGRSTFYTHFYDKEDLLLSGLHDIRRIFEQGGIGAGSREASVSLGLFRHVEEYRQVYRALVGNRAGEQVLRHVHRYMAQHLRERLDQFAPPGQALALPRELIIGYLESTLVALLSWWLEQGAAYSAAEMSAMFRSLVLPGMLEALPLTRERAEAFL